jgi:hypothetical protein
VSSGALSEDRPLDVRYVAPSTWFKQFTCTYQKTKKGKVISGIVKPSKRTPGRVTRFTFTKNQPLRFAMTRSFHIWGLTICATQTRSKRAGYTSATGLPCASSHREFCETPVSGIALCDSRCWPEISRCAEAPQRNTGGGYGSSHGLRTSMPVPT